VQLLDISLDAGAELSVPVPAGLTAFVLPIAGSVTVNGQTVESDGAPVPVMTASAHEQVIHLQARQGPVKAALLAGQPLNQPVYWQGPMAMASPEALAAALAAYRRGDLGSL
jgi:redox-sensitive bicupin YhaK (pirin superfamily)